MDPVTLDTFRRNAYRILGLQSAATQEQIDGAARLMRLHSEGDAPATPNDVPWLGPIHRMPRDVDDAVMRLTDPETRTAERLWWFCNPPPKTDGPGMPPASQSAAAKVRFRHDEAVTGLCRLLIVGAGAESLERWRGLLAEFRAVGSSDAYLQWMLAVELAGEFEKPANAEEVAAVQALMGGQAATALVGMADDFLGDEAYLSAGRVVGMLNEASAGREGPAAEASSRILNRMEDALVGRCNECMAAVSAAWSTKKINVLKPACLRATHQCQAEIDTLYREVLKWSVADVDRSQRVRGQVVKVYSHIADAYEACLDKYSARQTLLKSVEAAQGTAMEPRIRDRINSLSGARPVKVTSGGGGGFRWGSSGRWPLIAVGVLVANLLRFCATESTKSTSYQDTNYNNGQRYSQQDLDQLIKDLNRDRPTATAPGVTGFDVEGGGPNSPARDRFGARDMPVVPVNIDAGGGSTIPPLTVPPTSLSPFPTQPGTPSSGIPGMPTAPLDPRFGPRSTGTGNPMPGMSLTPTFPQPAAPGGRGR